MKTLSLLVTLLTLLIVGISCGVLRHTEVTRCY